MNEIENMESQNERGHLKEQESPRIPKVTKKPKAILILYKMELDLNVGRKAYP